MASWWHHPGPLGVGPSNLAPPWPASPVWLFFLSCLSQLHSVRTHPLTLSGTLARIVGVRNIQSFTNHGHHLPIPCCRACFACCVPAQSTMEPESLTGTN